MSVLPTSSKAMATLVNLTPGLSATADVGGASGIFTTNQTYRYLHHGKGGAKIQVNVDVYNVLNASTILAVNKTYGRNWLLPVAPSAATEPFLQGRLIEIGGQFRY